LYFVQKDFVAALVVGIRVKADGGFAVALVI
jgi:hypothetical protein